MTAVTRVLEGIAAQMIEARDADLDDGAIWQEWVDPQTGEQWLPEDFVDVELTEHVAEETATEPYYDVVVLSRLGFSVTISEAPDGLRSQSVVEATGRNVVRGPDGRLLVVQA